MTDVAASRVQIVPPPFAKSIVSMEYAPKEHLVELMVTVALSIATAPLITAYTEYANLIVLLIHNLSELS